MSTKINDNKKDIDSGKKIIKAKKKDGAKKVAVPKKIILPEISGEENKLESDEKDQKDALNKKKRYYEAVGRRKTSVARVRLWTVHPSESAESGNFTINGKKHTEYFLTPELRCMSEMSLRKMKSFNRFQVSVVVKGGGISSQAEAVRHGIARSLVKFDFNFGKKLRRVGFLTRDPRMRERKKFGLKRARRSSQWSKRSFCLP